VSGGRIDNEKLDLAQSRTGKSIRVHKERTTESINFVGKRFGELST